MKKPMILLYDIETSPIQAYAWSKYKTNLLHIIRDRELLSISWKWLGDKKIHTLARKDFLTIDGDLKICKTLWNLMSAADALVGHNIKGFDNGIAYARFLKHGLGRPNIVPSIDTLSIARENFNFSGNSLNDLAQFLDVGQKRVTGGFYLWLQCMKSEKKALREMGLYNHDDVRLVDLIYPKLLPFVINSPNFKLLDPNHKGIHCNNSSCGSNEVQKRGISVTAKQRKQRYQCMDCGCWFTGRVTK